ncbi:uncharacterized protein BXZ73DRAFT_103562 [Epithele typhae]|uniref:uncharacterized protein n=1 Tax=Epithele typhae TaxID=378194 RepID=UPI002007BD35|nr:uncharacterized protein BXZ73DRAFT_103562 [Epithele typhae]KAH9924273.1 hypothetical protein BXZ73DRAFT_103562 [Epithele typhae]
MSSISSTTASTEELTGTFGVLLVGFIFAVVLYGLTFFQTYIYYTRFPHDKLWIKWLVGLLWAMDTAITTLISHTIYHYLITNFVVPFSDLSVTTTFLTGAGLGATTGCIVQCFYAYRVWTVAEQHRAIPCVIAAIAVCAFAMNLAGVVSMSSQDLFINIVTPLAKILAGISFGLLSLCDIVILGSMYFYMQPKRNPGMAMPEGWYEKAVVYCFNRGTAFTIMQVVVTIVFVAAPRSQVWILLRWVSNKVYTNSLLAMLNFRNTHRGRGVNEEDSLNQHASNRTGSVSIPAGARETARSVQFNVNQDAKTRDPMSIIELDVRSHMDRYDDETPEGMPSNAQEPGKTKHNEYDEDMQ